MKLILNAIRAVGAYFANNEPSARDRYLAQAADLADLEARARRIEQHGLDPKFWP